MTVRLPARKARRVTSPSHPPRPIAGLSEIASSYDALLCDIWGVVHDGLTAHPPAVAALEAFRGHGTVVLITNAPRPAADVAVLLERLGAPATCYDTIITSGEVAARLIAERIGEAVYHLGPERDRGLFAIAAAATGRQPHFASPEEADYVLCTGLFNDSVETPDDYAAQLSAIKARGLPFICANPDIVVHRGEQLVYCAGALAEAYRKLGGETVVIGKPYRAIYEAALQAARARRPDVAKAKILAIGDAVATDLKGAEAIGVDALFVVGGIHRDDVDGGRFSPEVFKSLEAPPRYWIDALKP